MNNNCFSAEQIENFEQKCLCVFVADVSESMIGDSLNEVNKCLQNLYEEISSDDLASLRLELSLIASGQDTVVVQTPSLVENFTMPKLEVASGNKSIVNGIDKAIELLEARKIWYKESSQPYYRPWIILLTDGKFRCDIEMEKLSKRIKHDVEYKKYVFSIIGVGNTDWDNLKELSCGGGVIDIRDIQFGTFFRWLSASMGSIANQSDIVDLTSDLGCESLCDYGNNDDASYANYNDYGNYSDISYVNYNDYGNYSDDASYADYNDYGNYCDDADLNGHIEPIIDELSPETFAQDSCYTYQSKLNSVSGNGAKDDKENRNSFIKRLINKIFFNRRDRRQRVFCSVCAPSEIKKKSHMLIQCFLHHIHEFEIVNQRANKVDQNAEQRDYCPLLCNLKNGDRIGLDLEVYGEGLMYNDKKTVIWTGVLTNCTFDCFIPETLDVENLYCQIKLNLNGVMIGEMSFVTKITESPRMLNTKITSKTFKKIFISYAHQDIAIVKNLAFAYKAQGVDYFFDHDKLNAGDVFEDVIFKYIDSADLFILCWSANASRSDYVSKERKYALQKAYPQRSMEEASIRIFPLSIPPETELPDDMKDVYHFEKLEGFYP